MAIWRTTNVDDHRNFPGLRAKEKNRKSFSPKKLFVASIVASKDGKIMAGEKAKPKTVHSYNLDWFSVILT